MSPSDSSVEIILRIPGVWSDPDDMMERLPFGYRIKSDTLVIPDGSEIEIVPRPRDGQFYDVFRGSCRQKPTDEELDAVRRYKVNVCLSGPGGSRESALRMMRGGAAIIQAGGAGVFIDNSGLSHGGQAWIQMSQDGSPDALSFGYVGIIHGHQEMYTMGMHVFGLPDISMPITSPYSIDEESIVEILRYMCASDRLIDEGHLLADEQRVRWKVMGRKDDDLSSDHPMHNPFGKWKLVSCQGLAESN